MQRMAIAVPLMLGLLMVSAKGGTCDRALQRMEENNRAYAQTMKRMESVTTQIGKRVVETANQLEAGRDTVAALLDYVQSLEETVTALKSIIFAMAHSRDERDDITLDYVGCYE